jgi:hypothetical protein
VFTLAFERKHKVLLARFYGVFSSDDVAELDRAVIEFVARTGPVHGLLDFTGVEAMTVPMSKLVQRARQPPISPGYKRVFVIGSSQTQEFAREFAAHQASAGPSSPRIVATLEEAYTLLRLGKEPRFEPIA